MRLMCGQAPVHTIKSSHTLTFNKRGSIKYGLRVEKHIKFLTSWSGYKYLWGYFLPGEAPDS